MNNRNIKLLYIISILFWFSLYSYVSEFSIYAIVVGASLSQLGLIAGCYGLVQTLARIPLGLLSDILGKRKFFISLAMLSSVVANTLVLVYPTITSLYIFKCICGFTASCWVLYTITYASYFPKAKSGMAIGHINEANSIGQISGLMIGGVLMLVTKNIDVLFKASILAGVFGFILSLFITEVNFERKDFKIKVFIQLFKDRNLLICSVLAVFVQMVMYGITFTYGPMLAKDLGLNSMQRSFFTVIGIIPTAFFAKTFCSTILNKIGAFKILITGYITMVIMIIVITQTKIIGILFISHLIIGFGYAMTFPLLMALSGSNLHMSKRTNAMSIFQAIYGLGILIGSSVLGFIIERYNIYVGFYTLGGILLIAIIIIITNFNNYNEGVKTRANA